MRSWCTDIAEGKEVEVLYFCIYNVTNTVSPLHA